MVEARRRRILVVDDSAVSRRLLSRALGDEPDMEVVAEAADAFSANALILEQRPDVITLDLELPRMDGLAFLRHLMKHDPLPVIVVSSHTPTGSVASIDALRMGAVDVIPKPKNPQSLPVFAQRLKRRVRELAMNSARWKPRVMEGPAPRRPAAVPAPRLDAPVEGLIAIGASTGGPQALEALLAHLPPDLPPIVIVQHMPAEFTRLFAKRLDDCCPIHVGEAQAGQDLARGNAYVAPGDEHLTVERCPGGRLRAALGHGRQVHHQRPSVDVLFQSLLKLKGVPIVGVLLTGMGQDGADGMVGLTAAGHQTIAEDERSCVVFGMPREAIARGGAKHVVPLDHMPMKIIECLRRTTAARRIG